MTLPTRLFVVTLAVAAASSSLLVSSSGAYPPSPKIDPCTQAPADHAWSSQPLTGSGAVFNSTDTSYASTTCGRYIVDTWVPANPPDIAFGMYFTAVAGLALPPYSGLPDPLTKTICQNLTVSMSLYSWTFLQAGFQLVKSGTFKGAWSGNLLNPGCKLTQVYGDPALSVGESTATYGGNATAKVFGVEYRVAVAVKVTTLAGDVAVPVVVMPMAVPAL